jgi:HK97 family phage major capsid protein
MTQSNPDAVVAAEGGPTPKELDMRNSSAVISAIESLRKRERETLQEEMVLAINELDKPERGALPEFYRQPAEHRAVSRFSSPTEPLYRGLSEEEREWRNPDSDFWIGEWLRGRYNSDHGKMLLAGAKLDEMFPRAVMTEGTAGAGGAVSTGTGGELVPRPLEAIVYIARDRVAKMRRFATIFQMTAQQHNVPTAASMTAAMVAEGTGAAQSEPAVAQVPLVAHVAGVQARATKELVNDSAYNLVTILSQRGGAALGVLEDNEFFKDGTGTAPHVTKLSGTGLVLTTATFLPYSDVLSMYHTLGQQYRDNAIWFIESGVLEMLGNVRDGNGRPFYQGLQETPGPITDDPSAVGTILRKPVYEVPLTAGDIWFGDPSQYVVGNRQGIEIAVSEHARFLQREVVWMITERIAGNNTDTAAAQYTTGVTSATSL